MAGSFVAASSQRLLNSAAPLVSTAYPLTVGAWVYPTTTGSARAIWAFSDPGSAATYLAAIQAASDVWAMIAGDAGGTTTTNSAGPVTPNAWAFVLARYISATNRRIEGILPDGSTFAQNNGTSRTPTGLTTMAIGARELATPGVFFSGNVAEFWYTQSILFGQTVGALPVSLLRQLAYGGPFSVPAVAKDIVEYRSLRAHPTAGQGRDIYVGAGAGAQAWSNVNGVTIGPHPPLPYWYENPRQRKVPLPF